MFFFFWLFLLKGVHHLFSDSVWGWKPQHQVFSGLHQCYCLTSCTPPSQKGGSHSDHQSLHFPGSCTPEQECWQEWRHQRCFKHRWNSSYASSSVLWVVTKHTYANALICCLLSLYFCFSKQTSAKQSITVIYLFSYSGKYWPGHESCLPLWMCLDSCCHGVWCRDLHKAT